MSCLACLEAQLNNMVFPYRWKNANVLMAGCAQHIREIMKVLNEHSEGGDKASARTDQGERA